jgi:DNA uptake protein ComE-like DNA-binding protein
VQTQLWSGGGIQQSMKTGILFAACCLGVVSLIGCNVPNPSQEQVREKTADATAAIKRDSKAMAQGIKEGWTRDKNVDVNSATAEQLQTLPGIDAPKAKLIIQHRPYPSTKALVTKKVLSKAEYDEIAGKIQAK